MLATFDENQKMQLLKGTKVLCIKDVICDPFCTGNMKTYFLEGVEYPVPVANSVLDSDGKIHTWSIVFFRKYFKEIKQTA